MNEYLWYNKGEKYREKNSEREIKMGRTSTAISFAVRDASKSRVILFLIITSLAICSLAVLTTTAIFDGFKQTLENGAINADGDLVVSAKDNPLSPIPNLNEVSAGLGGIENIKNFSIRSYGQGGIKINDNIIGAYAFLGVTPQYEKNVTLLQDFIIEGRFVSPDQPNEVVFGLSLADTLIGREDDGERVHAGEQIEIISPAGILETYTIVGIMDAKSFRPNWTAYFEKGQLETIDTSRMNSEITIKLNDFDRLEETKQAIEALGLNIGVATWEQKAGYIEDILDAVSFITETISRMLIVTVFIILSIIVFINVQQKKKQIGIMKSMGASTAFVVSIFVMEGMIYSILAFSIGALLFMLIHFYSQANPISLLIGDFITAIDQENIVWTLAILLVAALLGSFVPAYIAARARISNIIEGN